MSALELEILLNLLEDSGDVSVYRDRNHNLKVITLNDWDTEYNCFREYNLRFFAEALEDWILHNVNFYAPMGFCGDATRFSFQLKSDVAYPVQM